MTVDVAYGGMWYAIADADALGIPLTTDNAGTIARIGSMIRAAAAQQVPVVHPENPAIANVSIAQLSAVSSDTDVSRRNAVVICSGDLDWERPETWRGVLDRSPCGTGTCAKMATLHARGELDIGEDFFHQGILDTVWTGRLLSTTSVGGQPAVAPRITGRGWIYGRTEYSADPADPFPDGYMVADIWPRGS
ncbi:MAG: proline racemase [Gammaproteobacteria bacterium]